MREIVQFLSQLVGDNPWRFASVLALALLAVTFKFVTDWPSLARLLVAVGVLVGISLIEVLWRSGR